MDGTYSSPLSEITECFNNSIRIIGNWIEILGSAPLSYEAIIDNIDLDNTISNYEGVDITINDIIGLITNRFPKILFYNMATDSSDRTAFNIIVDDSTTDKEIDLIHTFLHNMKFTFKKVNIDRSNGNIRPDEKALQVELVLGNKKQDFEARDCEYWFDHAEAIYHGNITISDIDWIDMSKTRCYLDASTFESINLRNAILLYDNVIISPPYKKYLGDFLNSQKVSRYGIN